ncbi:hypothetical protein RND81_13G217800 [Saponaria officinalis]|uniref:ZF-HD dimerization-type domain-containing protein n=1 Tax=Saponaria officinalis TaxID=3572 RepID=A0AAW1H6T6_SAPOF
MEFEDEDRDEEEEEDDDDDDDDDNDDETMRLLSPSFKKQSSFSRYRECLKNHAVSLGGHAVDGCGEFMPAGPDGSFDALKCAACNCHRNFHRKEILHLDPTTTTPNHHHLTVYTPRPPPQLQPPPHVFQFYPYNRTPPAPTPARPLALPSPAVVGGSSAEDQVTGGMMTMTMTSSSGKKRHRTKFTQEQKDKMLGLAERLGWRIQKQDETVVRQFCDETGVERHVLKVWMHNNKHTLGSNSSAASTQL